MISRAFTERLGALSLGRVLCTDIRELGTAAGISFESALRAVAASTMTTP